MYFTWEYAVWIIIITKLVCWLVICFNLLSKAQIICFSYKMSFYRTENQKKITFSNPNMTTFGPTYKENCLQDYCEFFSIYKLLQFLKTFSNNGQFVDWRPDFDLLEINPMFSQYVQTQFVSKKTSFIQTISAGNQKSIQCNKYRCQIGYAIEVGS